MKFALWPMNVRLQVVGITWKPIVQETPIEAFCAATTPDFEDVDGEVERFTEGVPGWVLEILSNAPATVCDQSRPGQGT